MLVAQLGKKSNKKGLTNYVVVQSKNLENSYIFFKNLMQFCYCRPISEFLKNNHLR